jgi:hypothetical protein
MSYQIQFACGATYTADKVERDRHGAKHLMVFAAGTTIAPPQLAGKPASCLWGCPAPVRKSKRQQLKAWVGDAAVKATGEPVWCVRCRPVRVTVSPND